MNEGEVVCACRMVGESLQGKRVSGQQNTNRCNTVQYRGGLGERAGKCRQRVHVGNARHAAARQYPMTSDR